MDNIEVTQPHLHTLAAAAAAAIFRQQVQSTSPPLPAMSSSSEWAARGAAFGDLDNDGDIDIVVTDLHGPAHLLRNQGGNRNHWIALDLRGVKSNRDALGAQVRLTTGEGKVQYASVFTAGSYLSASDRRVHFGLGQEQASAKFRSNGQAESSSTSLRPSRTRSSRSPRLRRLRSRQPPASWGLKSRSAAEVRRWPLAGQAAQERRGAGSIPRGRPAQSGFGGGAVLARRAAGAAGQSRVTARPCSIFSRCCASIRATWTHWST